MAGDTYYKEVRVTMYSVQPRTKLVYTVYMRLDLISVLALLLLRVNGRSVTSQRSDQSEAQKLLATPVQMRLDLKWVLALLRP